jgi:hypothetical protein
MLTVIDTVQLQISAEDKLLLLNRLDRWRAWKSLNDRRLCLGCGRMITGHEIETTRNETDGSIVHCPTTGCQSIPLDWILPSPRDRESCSDVAEA